MPYTDAATVRKYSMVSIQDFKITTATGSSLLFATDADLDSFIDNTLVPRAEDEINKYCDRKFAQTTGAVEKYDGSGFDKTFALRNWPVISITSVELLKSDGTVDTTVAAADYYVQGENLLVYKKVFPAGFQNIKVTYTYGYATVPATIQDVAARSVSNMLNWLKVNKMGALARDPGSPSGFGLLIPQQEILTFDLRRLLDSYIKSSFGVTR